MKVYVVVKGSYSDYTEIAVFSTEELAKNFINMFINRYDGPYVKEYELDEMVYPEGMANYQVSHGKDGLEVRPVDPDEYVPITEIHTGFFMTVWAKDEDHAKKIALDKFAQFKASKDGL